MSEERIVVIKSGLFFAAPVGLFQDTRLSWESRGVMGYLLSQPDGWVLRNEDLIHSGNAGRDKVKRIIKELKTYGYVNRTQLQDENGRFITTTEIYENPALNPAFTVDGFSDYGTVGLKTVDGSTVDGKPVDIDTIVVVGGINNNNRGLLKQQQTTKQQAGIECQLRKMFSNGDSKHLASIAEKMFGSDSLEMVTAWIHYATNDTTLRNPPGFVRTKIQNGEEPPPMPEESSNPYEDFYKKYPHIKH